MRQFNSSLLFLRLFRNQQRSAETGDGQRAGEAEDFGGYEGAHREKCKDIGGDGEEEPGAEKCGKVRRLSAFAFFFTVFVLFVLLCILTSQPAAQKLVRFRHGGVYPVKYRKTSLIGPKI